MLQPLPTRIKVKSLGGRESCYRVFFEDEDNGMKGYGYLTYELAPNRANERNVIVTDCDWLIEEKSELKRYYRVFLEQLKGDSPRHREPAQYTQAAKYLVNALASGTTKSERLRVVVHRYGSVPAFSLDYEVRVRIHGRDVPCIIALFPQHGPKFGQMPRAPYTPYFMRTKGELRESLRIAPSIVFRRYFEDVVEDFHDLRRTVRERDILRRAKQAETRLAESIQSKLKLLIPSHNFEHSKDAENQQQWNYFTDHDALLYEVSYARALALLFLNDLYPIKGIKSRSEYYYELLQGLRKRFVALVGSERVAAIEANSMDYKFLQDCFSTYAAVTDETRGVADSDRLRVLADDAPLEWQKELCKFAAFVRLVRTLTSTGLRTRVFISYHYDILLSQACRDYVCRVVEARFGSKVECVFLPPMPPDTMFRHVARAAIWASHGTLALCPADTKAVNTDADKDYKWIARETEYTLLLQKDVLFGMEKGLARETIRHALSDSKVGYLVTGSKLPADQTRASALVQYFDEKVHVPFQVAAIEPSFSAPELSSGVVQFLTSLSESAVERLLNGYLAQFTPETQRTMVVTLVALGHLGKASRRAIVGRLADAWPDVEAIFGGGKAHSSVRDRTANRENAERIWNKAFGNLWNGIRERLIDLGKNGISLLAFRRPDYRERLLLVLRTYLPQMSREDLRSFAERWLNKSMVRFGIQPGE